MRTPNLFPELDAVDRTEVTKSAIISPCGQYRYRLIRTWDPDSEHVLFVMLNPSTADADVNDPTIRRCMGFARSWGFGGIVVVNLFALRATNPSEMDGHPDPVGPDCDVHISKTVNLFPCGRIVAAWGANKNAEKRAKAVRKILTARRDVHCLSLNADGSPRHPLYVGADVTPFVLWAQKDRVS